MRALHLMWILALAAAAAEAQTTRYVTDSLKLEARSGPGVDNRILRMLESGTPVQVLEDSEGWSRVRLPGDDEGWILTRFLMDNPPARGRLASVSAALDSAREEVTTLEAQLTRLGTENDDLRQSVFALETKATALATELAELKRTAGAAVALRDENRKLLRDSKLLQERYDTLDREHITLRHARNRDWFVAGAGVLLGGILLGLVIPKIRWRRRKSWSEL
jgi:SH3 domain protein